jgi:heme-degrading monooxygenase HmoA
MTTVLSRFRVADYDHWSHGYAHAVEVTPGIRTARAWRAQDDPGLVLILETFDTREEAQAAWTASEVEAAMKADGIDMSSLWFEYFDEMPAPEPSTKE